MRVRGKLFVQKCCFKSCTILQYHRTKHLSIFSSLYHI